MTTPTGARKKLTRRVETAGSVVAGGAGASFGAAKLRDTHVAQYGKTHVHSGAKALAHVVPPRTAVKLATRNPGFKTLAIGTAAGAVAAAADHYGDHLTRKQKKMAAQAKRKEAPVSKSAFLEEPVGKAGIPVYGNKTHAGALIGGSAAAEGTAGAVAGAKLAGKPGAALLGSGGALVGAATGALAAASRRRALNNGKKLTPVAKGITDNPTFKGAVYNKDAYGGPNAKGNRKILRRSATGSVVGGAVGGTAAGAAVGGKLGGLGGAALGSVVGGAVGEIAGSIHGTKKAMRKPGYVAKRDPKVSAFGVRHP